MKVFCVRIGDKYGPEYETYLNAKLSKYDLHWIRQPFDPRVHLQWNKMLPMSLDIDQPVCVMDIDTILVNDYNCVFEYPIERGQFLAHPNWWANNPRQKINGGFFKYYPKDCRYIFDKFMQNPQYWQTFYIKAGLTFGPVNGEQFFVQDSVQEQLELKILPDAWFTRWVTENQLSLNLANDASPTEKYTTWQLDISKQYNQLTGNSYIYLGGEFHPDIKFVHFTHTMNKPHEWNDYNLHTTSTTASNA